MDFEMVEITKQKLFNNAWDRAKDPRVCGVPIPTSLVSGAPSVRMRCQYTALADGTPPCFIGVSLGSDEARIDADEYGLVKEILGCHIQIEDLAFEARDDDGNETGEHPMASFAEGLQAIHDASPPETWFTKLRVFAQFWGLQTPDVDPVQVIPAHQGDP